jgi:glycosyltransferase involved in cell wall biosynthesis
MISVITPTIWKYGPFLDFISALVQLHVIGEVIIIDNAPDKAPQHDVLNHPKVKHHRMEKNIFVNPAWNLGAELAQNDILCFLSDDVTVDLRAFLEAEKFVSKEIGILAIGTTLDTYLYQRKRYDEANLHNLTVDGNIKIKPWGQAEISGAGSLYFIYKANWIPIPKEFKLFFGDDWQFDLQIGLGRQNYYLNDCFYYTPWSVSLQSAEENQELKEYFSCKEYTEYENRDYYNSFRNHYLLDKIS